jgi:hypothetical protein
LAGLAPAIHAPGRYQTQFFKHFLESDFDAGRLELKDAAADDPRRDNVLLAARVMNDQATLRVDDEVVPYARNFEITRKLGGRVNTARRGRQDLHDDNRVRRLDRRAWQPLAAIHQRIRLVRRIEIDADCYSVRQYIAGEARPTNSRKQRHLYGEFHLGMTDSLWGHVVDDASIKLISPRAALGPSEIFVHRHPGFRERDHLCKFNRRLPCVRVGRGHPHASSSPHA